ncbi:MAG TPA: FAD:protein FMN transferase [Bryobacteraceae bacterium]|nr:FAD:protein FMN transferase [Bryobacteraceae bacterium]
MKQLVVLLLLAASLLQAGELLRLEDSFDAMGTTFIVIAYAEDQTVLEQGVEAAFGEVRRLDRVLSNYRSESEWTRMNREAAQRPVEVSPELFSLLEYCAEVNRQSEGTFDISVGPLMRVWGFLRDTGRLASKAEVAGALEKVGFTKVVLDARNRTVRFLKPGVELDPGGIGKGYAVDRMVDKLKEQGVESALISAGSSSIYGLGTPPQDTGWTVKIRHPRSYKETVAELKLNNESMSTSGDYEKFFEADGKMYSHIMDPRTGYPAKGVLSVSVTAPRTLTSEAWTKPFFVQGRDWAAKNRPAGLGVFLCEDGAKLACAWLQ